MTKLLIRGGTLVSAKEERVCDLLIEDGVIKALGGVFEADQVIDATGKLIMPGLIDCHVHFREPGFLDKATMQTESESAIAGGVTTVCEMPNTSPPTVTVSALADKVRRAEALVNPRINSGVNQSIDMRFFFGATEASHVATLRELLMGGNAELDRLKAQCCGVKLYFDHSTGDQKASTDVIRDVFQVCAEHSFPVVAHCEDSIMNLEASDKYRGDESIQPPVARHSFMRPPESEAKAISDAIALSKEFGTHLHVAHLSTELGLDLVRQAKKDGLKVTCEVAPHHLFLTTDDYPKLGALGKMNPPLRSKDDQAALWAGITDGTVDCIATDHAPHTLAEKQVADPLSAPSGVPGVETLLPLLLSVASNHWPNPKSPAFATASAGKQDPNPNIPVFQYSNIPKLCFENPNRIFNLGKKGIAEGAMADIIIVDPNAQWTITGNSLHSKCGWTPYEGWKVRGKIIPLSQRS